MITTTTTPVDILLGQEQGLVAGSTISTENMQKILDGVEKGNKENIYFYGLLKLYGIGVAKDPAGAAKQFLRASSLGHKEATTAYGVMKFTGGDGDKEDFSMAMQYFKEAVSLGDLVSPRNCHRLLPFTLTRPTTLLSSLMPCLSHRLFSSRMRIGCSESKIIPFARRCNGS